MWYRRAVVGLTLLSIFSFMTYAHSRRPWWANDFIIPPGIVRSGYREGVLPISGDVINQATNRAWCIGVTPALGGRWLVPHEQAATYGRWLLAEVDKYPQTSARDRAAMYAASYRDWERMQGLIDVDGHR